MLTHELPEMMKKKSSKKIIHKGTYDFPAPIRANIAPSHNSLFELSRVRRAPTFAKISSIHLDDNS